jgi:hypothetical protein
MHATTHSQPVLPFARSYRLERTSNTEWTQGIVLAIKRRLLFLIERGLETEKSIYIQIPSVQTLMRFFQCTRQEVINALWELEQVGYDHKIFGNRKPIIIWDSLMRYSHDDAYHL